MPPRESATIEGSLFLPPPMKTTTTWFGDGDDDEEESKGGPEAGNYEPPKDMPIPGETEGLDNSKQ